MPRVDIPVVITDRSATPTIIGANGSETAGDATNEMEFVNDGKTLLLMRNSGATLRNWELVTQASPDGHSIPVRTGTLAAGDHKVLGPFAPGLYNDSTGKVQINIDHLEVEFQAISLGA